MSDDLMKEISENIIKRIALERLNITGTMAETLRLLDLPLDKFIEEIIKIEKDKQK